MGESCSPRIVANEGCAAPTRSSPAAKTRTAAVPDRSAALRPELGFSPLSFLRKHDMLQREENKKRKKTRTAGNGTCAALPLLAVRASPRTLPRRNSPPSHAATPKLSLLPPRNPFGWLLGSYLGRRRSLSARGGSGDTRGERARRGAPARPTPSVRVASALPPRPAELPSTGRQH